MGRRARRVFTPEQRAELWERYRRGEPLKSIGRIFEKNFGAIYGILFRTAGIEPPLRNRSRLALTLADREEISRGLAVGYSFRQLVRLLQVPGFYVVYRVLLVGSRPSPASSIHLSVNCQPRSGGSYIMPLRSSQMAVN